MEPPPAMLKFTQYTWVESTAMLVGSSNPMARVTGGEPAGVVAAVNGVGVAVVALFIEGVIHDGVIAAPDFTGRAARDVGGEGGEHEGALGQAS